MAKKTTVKALNEFLDHMTSQEDGGSCMREKVRVYVPTCYNPKTKREECTVAANRVRAKMTKLFGGTTTWRGTGAWIADDKTLFDEPIIVVESAHKPMCEKEAKIFVNIIQDYAIEAKQWSVSIENGFTDFYIGKGGMFKPKYIEYGKSKRR